MNEMSDPRDLLSQDAVLMAWEQSKEVLETAKANEMEWRKYVVKRAFPAATEGTNTVELGNGYKLKAGIKYNYSLLDNDVVESTLASIAKIGNQGAFVADRLVSWTSNFLKTEYTKIKKDAEAGSHEAQEMLKLCHVMLEIKEAAPTLTIAEPKGKKK